MLFLKKTIGFMAVLSALPAAYAVTSRPAVITTASRRMPTMTATINGSTSGTTTSTTTSNLLANKECIDEYTDCMKEGDACGPNFEECTTRVLFHAKMPQCLSTLAQCSTAGVTSLFGTGAINALSNVATKNSYGEVTDYTYPTDGSVLGQLITGAAIANRYDTSTCVKRYTACLTKDSVCGADFELCTTDKEFKKQRVFCDSTLARCQSEGLIELFGSASMTATPSKNSRIGAMIEEGADLAAVNAVSTCYKVADQCILNACAQNPYKCYENSTQTVVKIVEKINSGDTTALNTDALAENVSKSSISAYIKNSCLDTIGSNKYCYATFLGNGVMPTASQLKDEDNQEEIYDAAITSRLNTSMKAKLKDLIDKFDTKAKQQCTETIRTCAMRTCGSGSGAACYSQVFGNPVNSINNKVTHNEIKTGCASIVNTDPYCMYAAANPNGTGSYTYSYINNDAFDVLFPSADESDADPIGVIASLNASLSTNYSVAAIAQMKRQCQAVATSCVKSMCGTDYVNCYRNRTDIYSNLTNTGDSSFDNSMNKVGGVLDYTIVLGLCLDTVKNASVCEEHLAIERNKLEIENKSNESVWGGANSTREGWIDAGSATKFDGKYGIAATNENGEELCTSKTGNGQAKCNHVDSDGNIYDQPVYISYTTYVQTQAATTLFKDLIYDLEKEAQAKYNAKITKQQNQCMALNEGGIMGRKDMGSAYMWVKLTGNKVPANYSVSGLKDSQMRASNDLYGSFCRARVTLQSDDKRIQDKLSKGASWATTNFAVGDPFTCGSWIPSDALEEIANAVADTAIQGKKDAFDRSRDWLTALGGIGGAIGGGALTSSVMNGTALSSFTGIANKSAKAVDQNKALCESRLTWYTTELGRIAKKPAGASTDIATQYKNQINAVVADAAARTNLDTAHNDFVKAWNGATSGTGVDDDVKNAAATAATAACRSLDSLVAGSTSDGKAWVKPVVNSLGTIAGGIGGSILVNRITKDVQQNSLDKAHREAYDAWMSEVGDHIKCFVGGQEVGEYGDILSLSLE